MYFKLSCPHCSKSLKVREEQAGKKCRCPYCKTAFVLPVPSGVDLGLPENSSNDPLGLGADGPSAAGFPNINVGSATAPVQSPKGSVTQSPAVKPQVGAVKPTAAKPKQEPTPSHAHSHVSDGSDISLVKSGIIGMIGAVAIFGMLYPLWLSNMRLGKMFWDSVGINFPTTLLMCWSFAILYLKSRQLAQQKSAMLLDLLPTEISREITLSSLDKFVAHIHSLPDEARSSILVNRVLRGIEHFRVRKSAAETVTMMESQSAIDASNVASSFTIIKVFIWAMPILGFIGTVMGVSSAVSGLSATLENAADVSAVTDSMKGVFGGLGTAFDTTLLALIMSMLVKIPTSAMQKSEDGLVTIADEYCNENLLRRLNDGREGGAERGAGGASGVDAKIFREAVEAAMGTHHAELESWLQKLDAIGGKLTTQVAKGWTDINTKMKDQQEQQLALFKQQYVEQTNLLQKQLQEMNASAVEIHRSLAELSGQAASMQSDVTKSVSGSTQALQTHFAGLERGLTGLSSVLESLGQKQVVVQQVETPKRGWFGGKKRNGRK
ncbi:MAG: MotA/TolQ/ExbB proton channel family protein [Planctomycetaceae bacterium]|nr:MotA/TolQ/ExbB proton channel family protein [Planctomycetales bacterium]MCB9926886.1 MotA/TolQ/ExbB proton channel family protein [Planctomycetaceae bacterium]